MSRVDTGGEDGGRTYLLNVYIRCKDLDVRFDMASYSDRVTNGLRGGPTGSLGRHNRPSL